MTLSYSQRAEYLESPAACPYCGSYQVMSKGDLKVAKDDTVVKRKVGCGRCNKVWNDIYRLHDIEELES